MRKRWILAAAAAVWVTLVIACGGSGAGSGDGDSTPLDGSATPLGVTPAIRPPQASPAEPQSSPAKELQKYLGETVAFGFPDDWEIWSNSYESEREIVVIANVPEEEAAGGLPLGAIRIEFTGEPEEPLDPLPGEVVDRFVITGVTFTVSEGEEVPWMIRGSFVIGGIDFRYTAVVEMNTPEPQMDVLRPILDSWVVGSTNNHPTRSCLPGECP